MARRGQFSRTHEVSTDGVTWSRAMSRADLFPPARTEATVAPVAEPVPSQPSQPVESAPPRTDIWHYHQLGTNYGPVDFSHLQYLVSVGQLSADDLVWKEGMPEWLPAARVPGLVKPNPASAMGSPPVGFYVGAVTQGYSPQAAIFPRVSGLSVASLVLGILWLWGIGSVLAVIFGSVALHQIRQSRGHLTGTGMAVAGLVLGIVGLTIEIIWAISIGAFLAT
jgi:hypothetical protein